MHSSKIKIGEIYHTNQMKAYLQTGGFELEGDRNSPVAGLLVHVLVFPHSASVTIYRISVPLVQVVFNMP
jgi:hypothetical protein